MPDSFTTLNLDPLKSVSLKNEPFPYMIIDDIIRPEARGEVVNSFPSLAKRGSFPLSSVTCKGSFATLIDELQRPELREMIGARFGMDLQDRPPMITVRGYTTMRDGHIHVDSTSKLITLLLYLNPNWQSKQGCLRLLYNNHDLNTYAAEVPPEAGRCLIFKVTPNCWHGHEPFVGERRTIQLNYVTSDGVAERQIKRHRFSAFLKKFLLPKKDEAPSTR